MSLFKSIATFGGFTLVSRITGFARDMILANFLGAGAVSDAFFVAFKLPNLFRSLFAEGAFTSAFVPIFSQKLVGGGKAQAIKFAVGAISVLVFSLGLFVLLMEIVSPGWWWFWRRGLPMMPARLNWPPFCRESLSLFCCWFRWCLSSPAFSIPSASLPRRRPRRSFST